MKPVLTLIPRITIHPDKIITYNETDWYPSKPSQSKIIDWIDPRFSRIENFKHKKNIPGQKISLHAKKKIDRATDYLLCTSVDKQATTRLTGKNFMFRIAFITLTLPSRQQHTDNQIKSLCLNSFIIELTRIYHVKNYIWRSELQQNGNIHFHILIDKFVPWSELRDRWNRIINKLGYVDRYRENMKSFYRQGFKVREELLNKWNKEKQFKAYQANKKTDFHNPNSTDIHSIRKINNIKMYISKYMTKSKEDNIESLKSTEADKNHSGRIWGCNQNLSNIKGAETVADSYFQDELKEVIKKSNCYKFESTYFSVYYIDYKSIPSCGGNQLFRLFSQFLIDKFNFHQQLNTNIN